jgi:hypothetical protein
VGLHGDKQRLDPGLFKSVQRLRLSIENPGTRVLDLWKQWTTIANKYDLHVIHSEKSKILAREHNLESTK